MSNMIIIGNLKELFPFKALGMDICCMDELLKEKKLNEIYKNVFEKYYKMIFITEEYFNEFMEIFESQKIIYKDKPPVVLPITNGIELRNIGKMQLRSWVERAIGVDIFKEK